MKVIIVEDDFLIADHLSMMLEEQGVKVLDVVNSVDLALKLLPNDPDLLFVDIRLKGEKTGIDLGEILSEKKIPFIYVSANNEMTTLKKATKTNPLSYITKPYKKSDVIAQLELFKMNYIRTYEVKTTFGKKQIKISDIIYFESDKSYVKIVTNKAIYSERNSMADLEKRLKGDFIRIHRSFLVNINHVGEYTSTHLYMKEKTIPISRKYKEQLKELMRGG
ncbi:MAG: DNA-binding response regulator [Bacteroidetes bacterium]|nr:MAG: DNA-binding response regulator [Bacteroidota bacterium]MBL1144843.1 DNA-binding response regulator [Bacteroidota bacterium]MCB0801826.1 DNA-binding response regulator [Flavobacteriales bacterium]NOG57637.1 DNA-binding response regulator [Bacteroidota bacterium]